MNLKSSWINLVFINLFCELRVGYGLNASVFFFGIVIAKIINILLEEKANGRMRNRSVCFENKEPIKFCSVQHYRSAERLFCILYHRRHQRSNALFLYFVCCWYPIFLYRSSALFILRIPWNISIEPFIVYESVLD